MIEEIKKEIFNKMQEFTAKKYPHRASIQLREELLDILDKYKDKEDKYKNLYFNILNNVVKEFYERTKDIKDDWLGYVDLDCPNCGRNRVEIIDNKLICEKCRFELVDIQELETEHGIGVE